MKKPRRLVIYLIVMFCLFLNASRPEVNGTDSEKVKLKIKKIILELIALCKLFPHIIPDTYSRVIRTGWVLDLDSELSPDYKVIRVNFFKKIKMILF